MLLLAVNLALILQFHDKSWIPSDDGHYVHVAQRLADGQVLNRDVEELHPGYVHFIHALALEWFGDELVVLRYPLVMGVAVQSLLVLGLLLGVGALPAIAGAVAATAIGPFQIASPTTSLYGTFATVALIAHLHRTHPGDRRRLLIAGVLVGAVFCFRQLSGVFVAIGLVTFLMAERQRGHGEAGWLARALGIILFCGTLGYLLSSSNLSGGLQFGIWPLGVIVWASVHSRLSNTAVLRMAGALAVGFALAVLPLVAYHVFHGSLDAWVRDVFVRALHVSGLEHIRVARYYRLQAIGLTNLVTGPGFDMRVNGAYWALIPFAGTAVGILLLGRLREMREGIPTNYALPVLAVFYALVSIFNQIPFYLYLSSGLSLCALLWLMLQVRPQLGKVASAGLLILSAIGLTYHAGQPYTRSLADAVDGQRTPLVRSDLPRHGLWMDADELERYRELLAAIEAETAPGESIFSLPNNPELYFLSRRANPFRLFNPGLSLLDSDELDAFLDEFRRAAVRLVIHNRESKYNVDLTDDLLAAIREDYVLFASIGTFDLYRRMEPASAAFHPGRDAR